MESKTHVLRRWSDVTICGRRIPQERIVKKGPSCLICGFYSDVAD